jgi:hypothetical protein
MVEVYKLIIRGVDIIEIQNKRYLLPISCIFYLGKHLCIQ